MVNWLLIRSSWRFFTRHPWQLWLTLLSIALGTAVIIAVDLANMTASQSFTQSVNALSGSMTHEITANDGLIPNALYRQLRMEWGYRNSTPQVEGSVSIAGIYYQLIGIDPFAYIDQPGAATRIPSVDIPRLLTEPQSILISSDMAQGLNVREGQTLDIRINNQPLPFVIIGVFDARGHAGLSDVILTDIATAQTALGKLQGLSSIHLSITEAEAMELESRLPAGLKLRSYRGEREDLSQMTEAFRINLTAMSLLAMLVGAFLVYNTMTFSVLQRRRSLAIHRMVGNTGAQLFRHMLLEAVVLGITGGLLGILLGVILGQGLLILVTQTISDLYVSVTADRLLMTPWLMIKGMGITLIAVMTATLAPALEAARVQPLFVYRSSHLEQRSQRLTAWLAPAGIACMIISMGLIRLPGSSLLTGFIALFLFIMGYSFLLPAVLKGLIRGLQGMKIFDSLIMRMSLRGVQASLSRTSLAIIALTIAVSATVGVSLMIGSFRASVADWLEMTLQSDLYISARSEQSAHVVSTLDPEWIKQVKTLSGIASVSTGHHATLETEGLPVPMLVLQPGIQSAGGFRFLDGDPDSIWQAFLEDEVILVSEPFAYHRQLQAGDSIVVKTGHSGMKPIRIAGIYQDYSATQGMVVLPRRIYERYWIDRNISSIGLSLDNDVDASVIKRQLEQWAVNSSNPVVIRSNREIRDFSLVIFDRTFAITHVLRVLVVIVAFIGVFSALMALFLEKGREFSILRATGFTPAHLRLLVLSQSALIGLLAGVLSLPLGWIMSDILIEVINQRSFGWTMQSHFFIGIPFQAILLAVFAALLAGIYPTWRISQVSLREGLNSL